MNDFCSYGDDGLYIESCSLAQLAEQFGTPLYVYSKKAFCQGLQRWKQALSKVDHMLCYSVKANSNGALLQLVDSVGGGFDVVSGGELLRVLQAGGDCRKIIFSGVGKRQDELELALKQRIYCINIESSEELKLLEQIAATQQITAPVGVRINPVITAGAHPHISTAASDSKFGIETSQLESLCQYIDRSSHLCLQGIACHIGSQIETLNPLVEAFEKIYEFSLKLQKRGIEIKHIDLGGGLGVAYQKGQSEPPAPAELVDIIAERLKHSGLQLIVEPGRSIAAASGVLLTRVLYRKQTDKRHFAVVDAATNDLLRPALYDAWHPIMTVSAADKTAAIPLDIVGPVCESGDILGRDRSIAAEPGDLLAVGMVGAYGFSMSSNYNSRLRPAEVLVDESRSHLIRHRDEYSDLWARELLLS